MHAHDPTHTMQLGRSPFPCRRAMMTSALSRSPLKPPEALSLLHHELCTTRTTIEGLVAVPNDGDPGFNMVPPGHQLVHAGLMDRRAEAHGHGDIDMGSSLITAMSPSCRCRLDPPVLDPPQCSAGRYAWTCPI